MTILELANALDRHHEDWDDDVVIVRPVVGVRPWRFKIEDCVYVGGELQIIVSAEG